MSDLDIEASTTAVREQYKFDEAALARWMDGNVAGFRAPLLVEQFKGGQPMLNGMLVADPIEDVVEGVFVVRHVGELDAVIGQMA